MLANVGIRRAEPEDFITLNSSRFTFGEPAMVQDLQAEGVFTYLAEIEEPIAAVSVGPADPSIFDEKHGELKSLCFKSSEAESVLSEKLLVHGLTVLKRRQFDFAVVWLQQSQKPNGKSHHFESHGFSRTDYEMTDHRISDGMTYIAYRRDLDDIF